MFDNIAAGNRIMVLRKQKGFTQEDLAEKLGISAQAVSKWENGHTMPETAMLPLLSKLLDSSIDSILMLPNDSVYKILSIEEINKIDKLKLKKILEKTIDKTAIVKAAKGVSPDIHKYLAETFPDIDFMNEHEKIGTVRIQEVEEIQALIIDTINKELIDLEKGFKIDQ